MNLALKAVLVYCVAQFWLFPFPARASGPTLHPVQYGKIILNLSCTAKSKLEWNSDVQAALKGLKKGDQVLAITPNGLVPARIGGLECLTGECHGNYVGIDLVVDKKDDVLGAMNASGVRAPKALPIKPVRVDKRQCLDLYSGSKSGQLPEVESERDCRKVALPGGAELLLAKKGFQQENGWVIYTVRGQLHRVGKEGVDKGPVFELDKDVEPLEPVLGLMDDKGFGLLWRKASGIAGPQAITVQWSQLKELTLTFGEPSTAGGQPCD